jgi:hypothetical protein
MKVKYYIQVDAVGGDFQIGTNDAPSQFPIASITDVVDVSVNGEHVSANVGDWVHALLCYNNTQEQRRDDWSTTTAMPDSYQELSDWNIYGSGRNPLAAFGENPAEPPRGGFPIRVLSPTSVQFEVMEPLLLSPMLTGLESREGFSNVNQFNIVIRHKSDLSLVWKHSSLGNAITSLNVSFYQQPEIHTVYITPDVLQAIPPKITYPYHKTQEYIKSIPSLGAGASTTGVVSDSVKLNQVPRRMYLFCRRSRATTTFLTADSFARIDKVRLNWNNQSSLLGQASTQGLYRISKKNGLNLSWPAYSEYRGSVFCAEFGTDIGLPDNQAAGSQGQHTFQVQIDITNTGTSSADYEFFTLFVLEGAFEVMPNAARATLGNLTQQAVLASSEAPRISYTDYEHLSGGGFFSGLKHFVNKVAHGVQEAAQLVGEVAPKAAMVAGQVAQATGGALAGGGMYGGGSTGGSRKLRVRQMRRF